MKLILWILFVTGICSFAIDKNSYGEFDLDLNDGIQLERNETFQYQDCAFNYTYPANIIYLNVTPYPLDFTRYMKIDYKIALRKTLVYPATLVVTFNFGFIRYSKYVDLCSVIENDMEMSCPLNKQLYQGYYKLSLRPYQYFGKSLNGIWARVMAISGKDEEVFMCVKFIIRAKKYH
ncbi:hypothetical protein LOD99_1226 [Oopsacas minuta]|uniref:MD-2-related lipid-recognition domain-containing protein n=1 Tax=Oopsacas minuta TaxID=111878 RepID=A0AAV7K639_9METZ|nr:hypothetical protein LOD99_1226 [Oopsacas minuta]